MHRFTSGGVNESTPEAVKNDVVRRGASKLPALAWPADQKRYIVAGPGSLLLGVTSVSNQMLLL